MDSFTLQILLLVILACLSAFFSGSETALFSLNKADLHRYSDSRKGIERSIYRAMSRPQNILITILIGNLLVNLFVSSISTKLLLQKWQQYGHLISIAIVTPVMIILCEITPKVISINSYESVSKKVYPLLNVFHKLFYPVRIFLLFITNFIIKIFRLKLNQGNITEDELDIAVNLGEVEGVIDKEEGYFIKNIMRFSKKEASNIMFPRNRAVFIPHGAPVNETMEILLENNIVRAPVYKNDLDHVVGYVDSKELIPYYMGQKRSKTINRFVHDIDFFPSSRELNDLLNDFLSRRIQMAILVDEYGGTAGVVTLNRILAELMGKGFTKWEVDSRTSVRRLSENVQVIQGTMLIADFNYKFDENLESVESETIGGYIIERLSHFPKRGEEIMTDNFILRVRFIRKNTVESIEVIRNSVQKGDYHIDD